MYLGHGFGLHAGTDISKKTKQQKKNNPSWFNWIVWFLFFPSDQAGMSNTKLPEAKWNILLFWNWWSLKEVLHKILLKFLKVIMSLVFAECFVHSTVLRLIYQWLTEKSGGGTPCHMVFSNTTANKGESKQHQQILSLGVFLRGKKNPHICSN